MKAFRNIRDEMREAVILATSLNMPPGDAPMRQARPGGGHTGDEEGTNIAPWMAASFAELVRAYETDAPFALISCFVNGEPTATIALTKPEGDSLMVMPLFVAVTPSMVVTDHQHRADTG
ncbi:hypothetical protein A33M_2931 [Rhodovulum sp. PH10]|uniref:hypothetical protein n=1 Tax=Rhodovulum sp. PH10 TaxID=1187851 RepID=UPI00027C2B5B|nr:hypothetical protein [Rhodovulum sp. PH10]EJW11628.1 hypothetical protein A33M_2931 [Rhodovulum sp. PH10]